MARPVRSLFCRSVLALALALFASAAAGSAALAGAAAEEEEPENPAVLALLSGLPAPLPVSFPWRPGRFTAFHTGAEEEGGAKARGGMLSGQLYRAPRPGPAPYAVLLSGCGGTYNGANGLWLKLWARALRDVGVGALALDSFDVRGVEDGVCGEGSKIWALRRVDDAYAALAWLTTQPDVDSKRIVVMGMSNGGRAALLSVSATENARFHHFAAAVALYPSCARLPPHGLLAPSLLLLGGADQGAPASQCEHFANERRKTAFPPQVRVYPDASHLFDVYPRDDNYRAPEVVESRADGLAFLRQALDIAEPGAQQTAAPAQ
jgi:dienelactone hydrolase